MTERESEQGIQANRPAQADTRFTSEEPFPELHDLSRPSPATFTEKPYYREHWLRILIIHSLVGGVCFMLLGIYLLPDDLVWGHEDLVMRRRPDILGAFEWAIGGAGFGLFVGIIFLFLMGIDEILSTMIKSGDK